MKFLELRNIPDFVFQETSQKITFFAKKCKQDFIKGMYIRLFLAYKTSFV